jgi:hypothetical protein
MLSGVFLLQRCVFLFLRSGFCESKKDSPPSRWGFSSTKRLGRSRRDEEGEKFQKSSCCVPLLFLSKFQVTKKVTLMVVVGLL